MCLRRRSSTAFSDILQTWPRRQARLVGPLRGTRRRAGQALYRLGSFDQRLASTTSKARSPMRACWRRAGILSRRDLAAIERGLARIRREIDAGAFALVARRRGRAPQHRAAARSRWWASAGKRLHTARSRNDQVATDLRLWLRDEIDAIAAPARGACRQRCSSQAERHAGLVMPGFTHLQVAQPVTFGHHLLAYVEMLERDRERLRQIAFKRINGCRSARPRWPAPPSRSTASRVARELGFEGLCENSLDAVSDRDFAIEFCACAALAMVHLSRLRRGARALDEPALRLRDAARPLLHRLLDHAAEEEPRRAGAGARQERPRRAATWWRCSRS